MPSCYNEILHTPTYIGRHTIIYCLLHARIFNWKTSGYQQQPATHTLTLLDIQLKFKLYLNFYTKSNNMTGSYFSLTANHISCNSKQQAANTDSIYTFSQWNPMFCLNSSLSFFLIGPSCKPTKTFFSAWKYYRSFKMYWQRYSIYWNNLILFSKSVSNDQGEEYHWEFS